MGEERSEASGHAVSQHAVVNRVAMVSVRSFVFKRPEQGEPAAWPMLHSSYAAVVMRRSGLRFNLDRNLKGERSRSTVPPACAKGQVYWDALLFPVYASLRFSPWVRESALGWDAG